MLRVVAELAVEEDDLAVHEIRVVDQISGPQTMLAQLTQFQPADTPERLEAWLARLHAYGPYMDATIEILREGRASGRTAARIVAERTIEQLERLLAVPIEQAIVPAMTKVASEADRERVRDVVRDVVYPADRRLLEALEGDYLAATREEPGLVSAPDGERSTGTSSGAGRRWTWIRATSTRSASTSSSRSTRSGGRSPGARASATTSTRTAARSGPTRRTWPPRREELVARANEDIVRAAAVAPTVFGRLPRAGCEVRPVEAFKEQDAPFAYYYPPTLDGSRPGIYYVNTYDLPSRTYSKLASTTYHEAIPGHHFQISLEMEHPSLNVFRRLGSRIVGGAYVEGWGLYAERLADELGLYRNDPERLGMLDAQAWRASRLIVDSGMHGLGWSRQRPSTGCSRPACPTPTP